MVMKAYKRDPIGMVMFVIYGLQTAGIVAFLIAMVYDYYPRGYIPAYLLFNGDALVQSSTFMGMWYVLFFWFASLTMFRSRIPNFYRIQCTYNEAHYIQVEKNEPCKYWGCPALFALNIISIFTYVEIPLLTFFFFFPPAQPSFCLKIPTD